MKISFLIPSPVTLKHDWYRDPLYRKAGVPNLAGYLMRAGFRQVKQYDFNAFLPGAYRRDPASLRLSVFADRAAVRDCMSGRRGPALELARRLLDLAGVEKARVFGISAAAFLGGEEEIRLGAALCACLARALKERFPGCSVVLGGLQNMDLSFQEAGYREAMRSCRWIDWAVCGDAHVPMLLLCRSISDGVPFSSLPGADAFKALKAGRGRLILHRDPGSRASYGHYFEPLPSWVKPDPSLPEGFPAYDGENCRAFRHKGSAIRRCYNLPAGLGGRRAEADGGDFLTLQVSFSEGCRFNCFFCADARSPFFAMRPRDAVELLKRFRFGLGCRHFLFYDPNFNPSPAYAREFLRLIIKERLDILWADCFNLRHMDGEMIAMMREAGVIKAVAGVEYPTRRMLRYVNKGLTLEKVNANLEALHKAGIWNHVLLITGLPTETERDVLELEDWARATHPYIDAYTVGSFHMALGSPFQREPERFGFTLKEALRLYCQSSFDEKGGLAWKEKAEHNARVNARVRALIDSLKGGPKATGARMDDSHLLMYLYRVFGHSGKERIRAAYAGAFHSNPLLRGARAGLELALRRERSGLRLLLARCGASLRPAPSSPEDIVLDLAAGACVRRVSIRSRSEDTPLSGRPGLLQGRHFVLCCPSGLPAALTKALREALRLADEGAETGGGKAA